MKLETESIPVDSKKNRFGSIEKLINYTNNNMMVFRPNYLNLRSEVKEILDAKNNRSPEELTNCLTEYFSRKLSRTILDNSPVLMEVSDGVFLEMPPSGRNSFQDRPRGRDGRRMSIAQFVQSEWGDYWNYGLLYSDHMRRADPSLYRACLNRAYNAKIEFADCLLSYGILGRQHLAHPPEGYEEQTRILKFIQSRTRTANADLEPGAIISLQCERDQ